MPVHLVSLNAFDDFAARITRVGQERIVGVVATPNEERVRVFTAYRDDVLEERVEASQTLGMQEGRR